MWTHSKHKNRRYLGSYKQITHEERVFQLFHINSGHLVTFESWQMAKMMGWTKLGYREKPPATAGSGHRQTTYNKT